MSSSITSDSLFGLALTTYRDKDLGPDAPSFFLYECLIAAIAVGFFRVTIKSYDGEPLPLRIFFALSLALLAMMKKSYEIICALQVFSYAVPLVLTFNVTRITKASALPGTFVRLLLVATSALFSLVLSHVLLSEDFFHILGLITPSPVKKLVFYLFPVEEIMKAYHIVADFVDPVVLQKQVAHLLFVTFNVQVGLGYLGIDFLKREQARRNLLVRLDMTTTDKDDDGKASRKENGTDGVSDTTQKKQLEASYRFQKSAPSFILLTAAPYMFQIILFGNMNMFAYTCLQHDIHRAVRLNELFSHDSHLLAMANDSATSPEGM
jgi:hypothetical protein